MTNIDGVAGNEIIILWAGSEGANGIDVIHDATRTTNPYELDKTFAIAQVRDYDGISGAEICYYWFYRAAIRLYNWRVGMGWSVSTARLKHPDGFTTKTQRTQRLGVLCAFVVKTLAQVVHETAERLFAMDQHPLRPALEQLHGELERVNTADPHQDLLRDLQRDTQTLLEQIDQLREATPHPDYRDRLGNAILRFEVSHPTLTAAMEQVAEAFNRIGI